jgi:hypothetical protein
MGQRKIMYIEKATTFVNIELYIQSGIVESYALGLASPREVAEFEQLLPHYPALREALSDFEYHLELFSIDQEVPPPPDIKGKIEARLREMGAVRRVSRSGGAHKKGLPPEYLPIETSTSKVVHKNWKTFCIVFFIVAKIFLGFLIYYYIEYRLSQKQIQVLEERLDKAEGNDR